MNLNEEQISSAVVFGVAVLDLKRSCRGVDSGVTPPLGGASARAA